MKPQAPAAEKPQDDGNALETIHESANEEDEELQKLKSMHK